MREATVTTSFAGRAAVVTGAASGIGLHVACRLADDGARVLGLDLNPGPEDGHPGVEWAECDVTDESAVTSTIQSFSGKVGSLDYLVSNAGVFTAGRAVDEIDITSWNKSLAINLTSHLIVLRSFLENASDDGGSIVFVGSRNVTAPGPLASEYSVPKAGLTQLARIAAIELGPRKIRVNIVHPDAVFDTAMWTDEVLASSASRYGLSVNEYRSQNVLGEEVQSQDVVRAICALLGDAFARTTGAQIPVDGGHLRVI